MQQLLVAIGQLPALSLSCGSSFWMFGEYCRTCLQVGSYNHLYSLQRTCHRVKVYLVILEAVEDNLAQEFTRQG